MKMMTILTTNLDKKMIVGKLQYYAFDNFIQIQVRQSIYFYKVKLS